MPDFIWTGLTMLGTGFLYGLGGCFGALLVLRCATINLDANLNQANREE